MKRQCARPGCTNERTLYGRYCRACATSATSQWRHEHRDEVRVREAARTFSDEQAAIRRARAYIAMYVRRGKLERGPCELCGDRHVSPDWDDPGKPLEVRWFCPEHRREHLADVAAARQGLEALRREFAAIGKLPATVLAKLHEAALRGLDGTGAEPGTLRYRLALQLAYRALQARQPL